MGAIVSKIFSDGNPSENIIIDFENAVPQTEEEKEIHSTVASVLNKGPDILERLSAYQGCEEFIRKSDNNSRS